LNAGAATFGLHSCAFGFNFVDFFGVSCFSSDFGSLIPGGGPDGFGQE
jgi:hypothetical protein